MPERKPTPFNLIAAESILGVPSTEVHDGELGKGIELKVKSKTFRVFPGAVQFTVPVHDISPDYGPHWIGLRANADGMPLTFALSDRGEVVFHNRARRPVPENQQASAPPKPSEPATAAPDTDMAQPRPEAAAPVDLPGNLPERNEQGEWVDFQGPVSRKNPPRLFKYEDGNAGAYLMVGQPTPTEDDPDHKTWYDVLPAPKYVDRIAKHIDRIAEQIQDPQSHGQVTALVKGYKHPYGPENKEKEGQLFIRAVVVAPVGQPHQRRRQPR
jgi:hypothetical protein